MKVYKTIKEIIDVNTEGGFCYFTSARLARFLVRKPLVGIYGGRYFVLKEQAKDRTNRGPGTDNPDPWLYSVKEIIESGCIVNVSKHRGFTSAKDAQVFARKVVRANLHRRPFTRVWWKDNEWKSDQGIRAGEISHYIERGGRIMAVVITNINPISDSFRSPVELELDVLLDTPTPGD